MPPDQKSGFRAGFLPGSIRETLKNGPVVGPEALLRNIGYLEVGGPQAATQPNEKFASKPDFRDPNGLWKAID